MARINVFKNYFWMDHRISQTLSFTSNFEFWILESGTANYKLIQFCARIFPRLFWFFGRPIFWLLLFLVVHLCLIVCCEFFQKCLGKFSAMRRFNLELDLPDFQVLDIASKNMWKNNLVLYRYLPRTTFLKAL